MTIVIAKRKWANRRSDSPRELEDRDLASSSLEIQIRSSIFGCIAYFSGDVVEATIEVLHGFEAILAHDDRVALDLSEITSFDFPGLLAILSLMDLVRSQGGGQRMRDESWESIAQALQL
jgi:hypothetical protein